jgi:hypothetical protein
MSNDADLTPTIMVVLDIQIFRIAASLHGLLSTGKMGGLMFTPSRLGIAAHALPDSQVAHNRLIVVVHTISLYLIPGRGSGAGGGHPTISASHVPLAR